MERLKTLSGCLQNLKPFLAKDFVVRPCQPSAVQKQALRSAEQLSSGIYTFDQQLFCRFVRLHAQHGELYVQFISVSPCYGGVGATSSGLLVKLSSGRFACFVLLIVFCKPVTCLSVFDACSSESRRNLDYRSLLVPVFDRFTL